MRCGLSFSQIARPALFKWKGLGYVVYTRSFATIDRGHNLKPAPSPSTRSLPQYLSSMATPTTPISLTNRCCESKSPYVRSHEGNPTAWQLWSPETLALAKTTNRLLFVSIGYAACHWCHVMAHESFDHPRIAQLLNEHFIPVKIDREERPDIDRQYMDFLQATNGGGGWPLNVFVTPDLEPIFGGTYWPGPKSERLQRSGTGFEDILEKVAAKWQNDEAKVRESGKDITAQLREFAQEGTLGGSTDGAQADGDDGIELDVIEDAYQHYKLRFDSRHGGFAGAPKFPTPSHLKALLRFGAHTQTVKDIVGDKEVLHARHMAVETLECMANGGIKDQIGNGFARYSVTQDWSLPHFEKMLYDNAQLLPLYLDAYLTTKNPLFLEMTHDIAQYLISEPIASPLGGFNSSEDADSLPDASATHKVEGAYYVWTIEEFHDILTEDEVRVCANYWSVKPKGNVDARHDPSGEMEGQNTLCVRYEPAELAKELKITEEDVRRALKDGRQKLLSHRETQRPRPALDDKIVVAWNGLAIGGLARASAAFAEASPKESKSYLDAAQNAALFVRDNLYESKSSTLRRVYRDGPGETPGFADDYAFFISGLLDLYEATFDDQWLELADKLQQTQNKLFWDEAKYAFFSTPANQPDTLIRTKDAMDNAEPSTNGVAAQNLFRLWSLLQDETYEKMARRTVGAFEVEIGQHPGLFTGLMSSVIASKLGVKGLMVTGDGEAAEAALKRARESVRPNCTVLKIGGQARSEWLRRRNDLLKDLDGKKAMVQLCEGTVCTLLGPEEIEGLFV